MIKKIIFIFLCLINALFVNASSLSDEFKDAIINSDINKVRILLKKGADVNKGTGKSYPIMLATYGDDFEIVELLIKHGANVNQKDSDGTSALAAAVMKESVREDENGHLMNVNPFSKSAELLLKNGADPNITDKYGDPPLAYCEEVPNAQLLLKYGANPNVDGVLYMLIIEKNFEVAEYLLDNGAKVLKDAYGFPSALIASAYNDNRLIDIILKQVDINSVDDFGNNILFYSAESANGSYNIIELMDLGANINHKNNEGETFIFNFIRNYENTYSVLTEDDFILLASIVDISVKNNKGQTILDIAEKTATKDLIKKYMLSYDNFAKIISGYSKNKNIKETINNLEKSNIKNILKQKPEAFTDTQYISILNDYAYFLSETERYKEAMPILERVILLSPDRAVAYLNLGDCYYKDYEKSKKQSDKDKVIENYKKYVSLLKKDAKIPDRVKNILGK